MAPPAWRISWWKNAAGSSRTSKVRCPNTSNDAAPNRWVHAIRGADHELVRDLGRDPWPQRGHHGAHALGVRPGSGTGGSAASDLAQQGHHRTRDADRRADGGVLRRGARRHRRAEDQRVLLQRAFGPTPTPWEQQVAAHLTAYR